MTTYRTLNDIHADNKKAYKKGKWKIGWVLFSACLCLAMLNLFGPLYSEIYSTLFPYFSDHIPINTFHLLADMLIYVFGLVFPFCIAMIACKTNVKKVLALKPRVTRNPFGFTFFVLGIGYMANLAMQFLLPWYNELFYSEAVLYDNAIDIVLDYISIAILPAVFEELVFRGVCINALRPMGTRFAVIFSAILFGLAHINPTQCIFAFIFGLLIATVYVHTGSIWPGVLLHFLNNSISFFAMYNNIVLVLIGSAIIYASIALAIVYLVKYMRTPGRFPIFVKEEKEPLLTGNGYTPKRAVLTNFWTYAFAIVFVLSFFSRYLHNWIDKV